MELEATKDCSEPIVLREMQTRALAVPTEWPRIGCAEVRAGPYHLVLCSVARILEVP